MKTKRSLFATTLLVSSAFAQTTDVTLEASARGWVNSDGFGDRSNGNYIAGQTGGAEYRNYFQFDLSSLTSDVVSASLTLRVPDADHFASADTSETFIVRSASNHSEFGGTGTFANTAIFNDLGSGIVYGVASYNEDTFELTIPLNFNFVDAINDAGNAITLGGALSSLSPTGVDEYILGNTNWAFEDSGSAATLNLSLQSNGNAGVQAPEPSSALLGMLGLMTMGLRRRRA